MKLPICIDIIKSIETCQLRPTTRPAKPADFLWVETDRLGEAGYFVTDRLGEAGTAPEIAVTVDGDVIAQNGTVSLSGRRGRGLDSTVSIGNTGAATLRLLSDPPVALSGDVAMFDIVSQPAVNIPPGEQNTFTLRYTPTTSGTHTVTITIANNDSNEAPFVFTVQGRAKTDLALLFEDDDDNWHEGGGCRMGSSDRCNGIWLPLLMSFLLITAAGIRGGLKTMSTAGTPADS